MKTTKVVVGLVAFVMGVAMIATTVSAATFTKTLKMGSKGPEVKALQVLLNEDEDTQVSESGAGSAGFETSYFGPATKRAVIKFQNKYKEEILTPAGLTKGTGVVGNYTLAHLNTMGGAMGTTTPVPVVTTTPVGTESVSIMAGENPNGQIVSGAAQTPILNFKIKNSNSVATTLNSIKFTKKSLVSDSVISNGYLTMNGQVVAQYSSLSKGVMSFDNMGIKIAGGETLNLTLRIDLSGSNVTNTILAFALDSASDVMIASGTTGGTFPINGGMFATTTVSNPSIASVSSNVYSPVSSTVDAGTLGFRAGATTVTIQSNPVKLMSVNYTVTGSINPTTDLANIKLRVDGASAGAGVIGMNNMVSFDLSATPVILNTGTHQIEVYVDVIGTPNRSFSFQILRPFDWMLVDTQYNQNISGGSPTGTATIVMVNSGSTSSIMNVASDTPTGTVAKGSNNVVLGKFTLRAASEAIRVKGLKIQLTKGASGAAWSTLSNVDNNVRNITLSTDNGDQIGTVINTPSSNCIGAATTITCDFGTSTSNVNYLIPSNVTRTISVKADIQSGASFDITSLKASIIAPVFNNIEGQTSYQTSALPSGSINGSALSIAITPFIASQNSSVGTQTFVGGVQQAKIGSFSLSASSAEGIKVTSVSITTGLNPALALQNLQIKTGSRNWNYQQNTVTTSSATTYTFSSSDPSGSQMIPQGESILVDVYADVLATSTPATYGGVVNLTGSTATGTLTNSVQTLSPLSSAGQSIVIAGAGTLTATVDSSVPAAQQISLGTNGVILGQYRLTANNSEDIRINSLTLTLVGAPGTPPATFNGIEIYNGATKVASCPSLSATSPTFTTVCQFSAIPSSTVLKNATNTYTVKASVADFTTSPASHNVAYNLKINAGTSIEAYGVASNTASTIAGVVSPLSSNTQTTLRTKATAALTPLGSLSGRVRTSTDDIANLTVTADSAYGVEFKSVTLKSAGAACPTTGTHLINLIDNETNGPVATASPINCTAPGTTTLILTTPFTITQGNSKVFKVRLDSSAFLNAASTSDSFSLAINANTDFVWQSQGTTETLNLPSTATPITTTVSFE